MATGAKLSIMGLYNYNPEIFSDLNVPTGIDKETVIDNILLECYDLELLFPSYNLMKIAIKNWSAVEQPIWQKLYNSENLEYNPIWNVDGDVTETREVTRARSVESSDTRVIDRDTSETGTSEVTSNDSTSGTSSNTHSVSGYNSSDLVISEKDDGTTSTTGTGSRNETNGGTGTEDVTETGSGTNSESETVGEELHTKRTGNIGVTTTQAMIREERDVVQFSTIKYITNSFKKHFCLLVY